MENAVIEETFVDLGRRHLGFRTHGVEDR